MISNNKLEISFLKNAAAITGCLSASIGLTLALSGLYEYYTNHKLLTSLSGSNTCQFIEYIKNIDDMSILQKTGIASPLLLIGGIFMLATAKQKKVPL